MNHCHHDGTHVHPPARVPAYPLSHASSIRRPSQHVGAPCLHLPGKGLTFVPGLHGKPGRSPGSRHTLRLEEPEIEVGDLSSPPIVVPYLGPDVEDDEEEATRPDHPADLIEGGTEFSRREIDEE